MTLAMEHHFDQTVESQMRNFFRTLGEKDRRRYAAIEARKLPFGGIRYIAKVLGCCENTIASGIKELESLADGDPLEGRQRVEGGGRPKKN
ncbi:hypothetical protein [Rhodopirellula baltica]|nr:hypothetical protein [Rhodopirellula baltica]